MNIIHPPNELPLKSRQGAEASPFVFIVCYAVNNSKELMEILKKNYAACLWWNARLTHLMPFDYGNQCIQELRASGFLTLKLSPTAGFHEGWKKLNFL